jgi:hypothetical protein
MELIAEDQKLPRPAIGQRRVGWARASYGAVHDFLTNPRLYGRVRVRPDPTRPMKCPVRGVKRTPAPLKRSNAIGRVGGQVPHARPPGRAGGVPALGRGLCVVMAWRPRFHQRRPASPKRTWRRQGGSTTTARSAASARQESGIGATAQTAAAPTQARPCVRRGAPRTRAGPARAAHRAESKTSRVYSTSARQDRGTDRPGVWSRRHRSLQPRAQARAGGHDSQARRRASAHPLTLLPPRRPSGPPSGSAPRRRRGRTARSTYAVDGALSTLARQVPGRPPIGAARCGARACAPAGRSGTVELGKPRKGPRRCRSP